MPQIKHIFSNKILSHINFFANFDENKILFNQLKTLTLYVSEMNLGISKKQLIQYNIKKMNFENLEKYGVKSKAFNFYSCKEVIMSTFEKNLVFFFNISLPICKICECLFDYIEGIHSKNLDYFDDVDTKFGLYDYCLLLNIKNHSELFFSIHNSMVDFKEDHTEPDYIYYESTSQGRKILYLILITFFSCFKYYA